MRKIVVVDPHKTQAIAASRHCASCCPHCRGTFLKGMVGEPDLSCDSFLISGGCDKGGRVCYDWKMIKHLKSLGKRLNIHACNVSVDDARKMAEYADVVSFDFTMDLERLRSYERLLTYCKDVKVAAHVIIGLGDEKEILDKLREYGADDVVFLILVKRFDGIVEPSDEHIEDVLSYARPMFAKIALGCMRPLDRKKEIDAMAVRYVDVIVNPWKGALADGPDVLHLGGCCGFWQG